MQASAKAFIICLNTIWVTDENKVKTARKSVELFFNALAQPSFSEIALRRLPKFAGKQKTKTGIFQFVFLNKNLKESG